MNLLPQNFRFSVFFFPKFQVFQVHFKFQIISRFSRSTRHPDYITWRQSFVQTSIHQSWFEGLFSRDCQSLPEWFLISAWFSISIDFLCYIFSFKNYEINSLVSIENNHKTCINATIKVHKTTITQLKTTRVFILYIIKLKCA